YITGWDGDDVRLLDRFYKGGESFRGFERAGIGPRDATPGSNEDAAGGQAFAIGTVEVTFPLGLPEEFGVRGAVFSDFGTLFDSPDSDPGVIVGSDAAFRASAGVGVLWDSPLGPIRFDLAEAFLKESHD